MKALARIALPTLLASLAACSTYQSGNMDYKSAGAPPTLETPPDISQLSRESHTQGPGRAVSANAYQAGILDAPAVPTATDSVGDVRMAHSGSERWLVVNRSPEQVWDSVRDFWQERGFLLTTVQRDVGIMETDWAENRPKVPQDIIRATTGKVLDPVYATGELDRFRTRLERTPEGTEIFVSHRGMREVYDKTHKDEAAWQPRPVDPELEAEYLRRLMVTLGTSQEQAKVLAAAAPPNQTVRVSTIDGIPVIQMHEDFDRTWRRVGLALDRTAFTVEDRDRGAGAYFVRYVTPDPNRKEPSIFDKLMALGSPGKVEKPLHFRIIVKSQGDTSAISVSNEAGVPESSTNAQRIVQVIADDMR